MFCFSFLVCSLVFHYLLSSYVSFIYPRFLYLSVASLFPSLFFIPFSVFRSFAFPSPPSLFLFILSLPFPAVVSCFYLPFFFPVACSCLLLFFLFSSFQIVLPRLSFSLVGYNVFPFSKSLISFMFPSLFLSFPYFWSFYFYQLFYFLLFHSHIISFLFSSLFLFFPYFWSFYLSTIILPAILFPHHPIAFFH